MEHSATAVPKGLTVEEVLQLAQQRWLRTPELCEILAKPEILKILFASQRKDKPTNGAIFAIYEHRLPEFKDDGHVWAKKESHENLKDKGVVVLICKYVYGKIETNFRRHIYQMKEHGDIVLFHYRKDQNQENRKIWRRGTEVFIVTPQSIQETGIVDHSSNRLPLPPRAANTGIVDHSSNQLPLPQQTANTSNLNIQENVESKGCSSGRVNHDNYQLPLAPETADTGKYTSCLLSVSEGGILHCDSKFENQSIPPETRNDFFTKLPYPAAPGSPSALPQLMKCMEPSLEENKKNLKRPIEILGEHPAKSFGQEHQDHMSFQQNTELQEGRNNCKCSKKQHIVAMSCSPPGPVHHNIQGSAASGGGVPSKKVIENDLPPKLGIPVRPCELTESIKNVEQFLELILPAVDHAAYFGDTTNESLSKRFKNMLSPNPSCLDSNMAEIPLEKKFHFWVQGKASKGENGVTVLDEGGAGLIHLAAGLGYDWVIHALIVEAKIDINFGDKNGCTALHWAAYCGRKNTVEFLISKDAAHALPSFPPGSGENTPANLAYVAGHEEIGDYLEEIVELSLTTLEIHCDDQYII